MNKCMKDYEKKKCELPEIEMLLIDFLKEQGVGYGHINILTVMKYGGKIRKATEIKFKKDMKEYYEIELLRRKFNESGPNR